MTSVGRVVVVCGAVCGAGHTPLQTPSLLRPAHLCLGELLLRQRLRLDVVVLALLLLLLGAASAARLLPSRALAGQTLLERLCALHVLEALLADRLEGDRVLLVLGGL